MSKEAMKLALEGAANYIDTLGGDSRKYRQALAEQPAQQCKWPTCQREDYQQALAEQIKRELVGEQPAQQEPVALPCCGYTDASAVKWNPFNNVVQCHNCGQVYTTPPQRTWVGLTDEEMAKALPRPWPDEGDRVCLSPTELRQFAHGIKENT